LCISIRPVILTCLPTIPDSSGDLFTGDAGDPKCADDLMVLQLRPPNRILLVGRLKSTHRSGCVQRFPLLNLLKVESPIATLAAR
jgi:hypothetical protein